MFKTVFRRVILVLLALLVGLNIYLLNARSIGGNQMPMPFGTGMAVVQSGSMEPTYKKGDLLFVKEKDDYETGDVVVYQSEGVLIVHRIINIDGDTVTTKGDANSAEDPSFDKSAIKGAAAFKIPFVGYVVDFLKTPAGIIIIVICAVLLMEISYRKEQQKEQQSKEAKRNARLKREIERLRRELDDESRVTKVSRDNRDNRYKSNRNNRR